MVPVEFFEGVARLRLGVIIIRLYNAVRQVLSASSIVLIFCFVNFVDYCLVSVGI